MCIYIYCSNTRQLWPHIHTCFPIVLVPFMTLPGTSAWYQGWTSSFCMPPLRLGQIPLWWGPYHWVEPHTWVHQACFVSIPVHHPNRNWNCSSFPFHVPSSPQQNQQKQRNNIELTCPPRKHWRSPSWPTTQPRPIWHPAKAGDCWVQLGKGPTRRLSKSLAMWIKLPTHWFPWDSGWDLASRTVFFLKNRTNI